MCRKNTVRMRFHMEQGETGFPSLRFLECSSTLIHCCQDLGLVNITWKNWRALQEPSA